MSGSEVFLLFIVVVLIALGWLPRNVARAKRLEWTTFAGGLLGVLVITRVYGDAAFKPFVVFTIIFVAVWFGSILILPKHSEASLPGPSSRKHLLLRFSTAPIFLIIGILDRENRDAWLCFMVYFILQGLHDFLVRLRTESKSLTPIER
ncbi:MAG TPA: hypothetical protein VFP10_00315 [Candidatus Eisenbacteria bacterium]|nr:hypothetical protein [Candidatus Eisenbacteria bacterium]